MVRNGGLSDIKKEKKKCLKLGLSLKVSPVCIITNTLCWHLLAWFMAWFMACSRRAACQNINSQYVLWCCELNGGQCVHNPQLQWLVSVCSVYAENTWKTPPVYLQLWSNGRESPVKCVTILKQWKIIDFPQIPLHFPEFPFSNVSLFWHLPPLWPASTAQRFPLSLLGLCTRISVISF